MGRWRWFGRAGGSRGRKASEHHISTRDRVAGLSLNLVTQAEPAAVIGAVLRQVSPQLTPSPLHGSLSVQAETADTLVFRYGSQTSTSFRAGLTVVPLAAQHEVRFEITKWTVAESGLLSFPEMSRLRSGILQALQEVDPQFQGLTKDAGRLRRS